MYYKISIIIPVYNAEKYLARSINSLINQSFGFENIEVILVDDNSTDSSNIIMKKFSKKYANIKSIFSHKNHGYPGYGRNEGIKNSNSKYIMFMDCDDEYSSDFCEVMYNYIERYDVDIVCSNHYVKKVNNLVKINHFSAMSEKYKSDDGIIFIDLTNNFDYGGPEVWNKLFKSSIIKENNIKFIEKGLNEDRLFVANYVYYARYMLYVDYYGYIWRRDDENLSNYSVKNTLEFIDSYYDLINFYESKYSKVDYVDLFRGSIDNTIIRIIFSSKNKKDYLVLLEKLYEFEKYIDFNGDLNLFWTNFLNKFILIRKFSVVIFLFKSIKSVKKFFDYVI